MDVGEFELSLLTDAIAKTGYSIPVDPDSGEVSIRGLAQIVERLAATLVVERAQKIHEQHMREREGVFRRAAERETRDKTEKLVELRQAYEALDVRAETMSKAVVALRDELNMLSRPKRRRASAKSGGGT